MLRLARAEVATLPAAFYKWPCGSKSQGSPLKGHYRVLIGLFKRGETGHFRETNEHRGKKANTFFGLPRTCVALDSSEFVRFYMGLFLDSRAIHAENYFMIFASHFPQTSTPVQIRRDRFAQKPANVSQTGFDMFVTCCCLTHAYSLMNA